MKFKIENIIDEYYSDKTYILVKLSQINGSFSEEFAEGDTVNITKVIKDG